MLYKLDGGLDHILIDEAQDTSPEQWAIVRKLTEEFFAGDGVRDGATRTVFAVGDEKQSIFSFQGADPTQFDGQPPILPRRMSRPRRRTSSTSRLATSRRSAPEILTFVDAVFADPQARAGLTSQGAEIAHDAAAPGSQGPRRSLAAGQALRTRRSPTCGGRSTSNPRRAPSSQLAIKIADADPALDQRPHQAAGPRQGRSRRATS